MKRMILVAFSFLVCTAMAQDVKQVSTGNNSPNVVNTPVPTPATGDIVVKSSPAEDALLKMADQMESVTKTYNVLLQQTRTNLDAKNKPIIDEMKARAKKWQDKIDADTKDLRAKADANTAEAQEQFRKDTAPLAGKMVTPETISTLEDIVKKEQNLPANAHFDMTQKKWVGTSK